MEDKILTVSIACYNASQYIDKCVDSLIKINNSDNLNKLDIILVDDGSKDDTYEKALFYQNKYSNFIKVIKKENGGWGSTFNESIKIASGKYFKLLDVDDWYKTDNLNSFIEFLKQNNSDLIISSYYKHNIKHDIYDLINECFNQMHALTFKTSILKENKIHLTENCFYTDMEYLLYSIKYCKTYDVFNKPIYVYNIGFENQSVSWESFKNNINQHFNVINELIGDYQNLKKDIVIANNDKLINLFKIYEDILIEIISKHYCILYKFNYGKENMQNILNFDNWLKNKNAILYNKIKLNRVKFLRKNTIFYPFLWFFIDLRSKIYNIIKFK